MGKSWLSYQDNMHKSFFTLSYQNRIFVHDLAGSRYISESLKIPFLVSLEYSKYFLELNCTTKFFDKSLLAFLRANFRCCGVTYGNTCLALLGDTVYLSYLPCLDAWSISSLTSTHTTDTFELLIFLSLKIKEDYCLKLNHVTTYQ